MTKTESSYWFPARFGLLWGFNSTTAHYQVVRSSNIGSWVEIAGAALRPFFCLGIQWFALQHKWKIMAWPRDSLKEQEWSNYGKWFGVEVLCGLQEWKIWVWDKGTLSHPDKDARRSVPCAVNAHPRAGKSGKSLVDEHNDENHPQQLEGFSSPVDPRNWGAKSSRSPIEIAPNMPLTRVDDG